MYPAETDEDVAFDLAARAQLAQFSAPEQIPAELLRHKPWWQHKAPMVVALGLLLSLTLGSLLVAVRPPALVLSAIEHEYDERTLRGTFMDPKELLNHFGLDASKPMPGYPQLIRPCKLAGTRAYHLTTFFEKGGMVTAYGFDKPLALKADQGWWFNSHWQVMTTPSGKTLVLVAQKKSALIKAEQQFLSHAG